MIRTIVKSVSIVVIVVILSMIQVNCVHQSTSHKQSILLERGLPNVFWEFVNSNRLDQVNVSSNCRSSLGQFNRALREGQEWPLIMLDASGRFPADSLGTGYADFGQFDGCLAVGQHCTVSLLPTLNESLWPVNPFTRNKVISLEFGVAIQLGLCTPSTCSRTDLNNILTEVLDSHDWKHLTVNQCKVKTNLIEEMIRSNLQQRISLALLLSIVGINLYCTWYHRFMVEQSIKSSHWSRHFSLINGFNSLIVADSTPRNTFLTRLSISVHSYSIGIHAIIWFMTSRGWGLFANCAFTLKHRHKWWARSQPDYFAEILYFYGGITHSFSLWKVTGPSTPLASSFKHLIIKMILITINLIPLTCFMIVMPLIVTGPLDYSLSHNVSDVCGRNLIKNLFFWQNNIRPMSEICFPHTWSIAVEYQLLPLIVILIHLYKRSPRVALAINALIVAGGFIYIAIYVLIFNTQPHDLSRSFDTKEIVSMHETLMHSATHIWIYLSSPLWAYLIINRGQQSIKLGKWFVLIVLSLHLLPAIWVGLSDYDGPIMNSIYWVVYRLFNLAFYTSIVMANCEQLRRFFAHPTDPVIEPPSIEEGPNPRFLHFVSTLLRSSYYAHVCVIMLYYNNQRAAISSPKVYIYVVIELVVLSLIGGFVFHLFVANPVASLFSSLLMRRKKMNSNDSIDKLKSK